MMTLHDMHDRFPLFYRIKGLFEGVDIQSTRSKVFINSNVQVDFSQLRPPEDLLDEAGEREVVAFRQYFAQDVGRTDHIEKMEILDSEDTNATAHISGFA
ncbi:hypothetical protein L596_014172 [Steinernema carpocapsae]|uniref:Uncharacterized protein n=1 Tax=Steinernema carpocapsae TaxID=34508 RepID=A0A4U5NAY5_STECR|nr:hypothetical protein L596_014172 [Steinernema carpocapsae]